MTALSNTLIDEPIEDSYIKGIIKFKNLVTWKWFKNIISYSLDDYVIGLNEIGTREKILLYIGIMNMNTGDKNSYITIASSAIVENIRKFVSGYINTYEPGYEENKVNFITNTTKEIFDLKLSFIPYFCAKLVIELLKIQTFDPFSIPLLMIKIEEVEIQRFSPQFIKSVRDCLGQGDLLAARLYLILVSHLKTRIEKMVTKRDTFSWIFKYIPLCDDAYEMFRTDPLVIVFQCILFREVEVSYSSSDDEH